MSELEYTILLVMLAIGLFATIYHIYKAKGQR
jgi:hypothetical protein